MLKLSFIISPLYITGGVLILLLLHMWNVRARIFHHDVYVLHVFEKVSHTVVGKTSLGHFKCWLLWPTNDKIFTIETVICH